MFSYALQIIETESKKNNNNQNFQQNVKDITDKMDIANQIT